MKKKTYKIVEALQLPDSLEAKGSANKTAQPQS